MVDSISGKFLATLVFVEYCANILATGLLVVRLIKLHLHSIYKFLFLSLVVALLETPFLLYYLRSTTYVSFYLPFQAVNILLAFGVVLELYKLALAGQPALASFGRRAILFVFAGSALIAAGGIGIDAAMGRGHPLSVQKLLRIERSLDMVLALFLLAVSVFLLWFPVKVKRNIAIYIGGYAAMFVTRSFGILTQNLLPVEMFRAVNAGMLFIAAACTLFWLVCLRPEAQDDDRVTGHRWDPGATEKLSGQLDAINAALIRFSRL